MLFSYNTSIYDSLDMAIKAIVGDHSEIISKKNVFGGDINDSFQIQLSTGEKLFMKTNSINNIQFFEAEAFGLWALQSAAQIGVPKVLGIGTDEKEGISFLLLEFINSSAPDKTYWENFGHQLAALHRVDTSLIMKQTKENILYGFPENNFIGRNVQINTPKVSWIDFYRECRLLPQIKKAENYFDSAIRKKFVYLLDHLDSFLREPEIPSLLHGDLWSGNALCGSGGKAWILDPAAYIGDFETDLAMTQLFGGFPPTFYAAYHEINPIEPEYYDRRQLYHLYHLLNHLNLFGQSYLGSVVEILNELPE